MHEEQPVPLRGAGNGPDSNTEWESKVDPQRRSQAPGIVGSGKGSPQMQHGKCVKRMIDTARA